MLQVIFYLILIKIVAHCGVITLFIIELEKSTWMILGSFIGMVAVACLTDLIYILYFWKKNGFIMEYPKLTLELVNQAIRDDITASELEEILR